MPDLFPEPAYVGVELIGPALEDWADRRADDHRPMAVEGRRFRASWSGKCTRQTAYYIAGTQPTDPADVSGQWRFETGQVAHDIVQPLLEDYYGSERVLHEVPIDLQAIGLDGAATLDTILIVDEDLPVPEVAPAPIIPGDHIVIEHKSINGYGFKAMTGIGNRGKPAEGPRSSAIVQGALGAAAYQAQLDKMGNTETRVWMAVAVYSLENLGKWALDRGVSPLGLFHRMWLWDPGATNDMAQREASRIRKILDRMDENDGNPAAVPRVAYEAPGTRVTDPMRGTVTHLKTGAVTRTWECDYCDFRRVCIQDGA